MTKNPHVNKLLNLVDYQEGTIVSKTLIDKKAGTATLFAFDKNQGLSEHTAPYDALVIILEGETKITISGKAFILKKDDSIIMPAKKQHAVYALTKMKMFLVMIHS
jgi:quercetin dioxygenase-like cupin family protein